MLASLTRVEFREQIGIFFSSRVAAAQMTRLGGKLAAFVQLLGTLENAQRDSKRGTCRAGADGCQQKVRLRQQTEHGVGGALPYLHANAHMFQVTGQLLSCCWTAGGHFMLPVKADSCGL